TVPGASFTIVKVYPRYRFPSRYPDRSLASF
ncbi:unnamed protein product, partial [marine sediment metagenome]